jgi:hypothetical protein
MRVFIKQIQFPQRHVRRRFLFQDDDIHPRREWIIESGDNLIPDHYLFLFQKRFNRFSAPLRKRLAEKFKKLRLARCA